MVATAVAQMSAYDWLLVFIFACAAVTVVKWMWKNSD